MAKEHIVTVEKNENERFLRTPVKRFDFATRTKTELAELVKDMRRAMHEANGVGLSANQYGLDERFFVAQAPDAQGKPRFYAVFNPEIVKMSEESVTIEEGCLSVPRVYGQTPRAARVVLEGWDINGKKLRVKAHGLLARIFQHEVDHLDGKLFVDRAPRTVKIEPRGH